MQAHAELILNGNREEAFADANISNVYLKSKWFDFGEDREKFISKFAVDIDAAGKISNAQMRINARDSLQSKVRSTNWMKVSELKEVNPCRISGRFIQIEVQDFAPTYIWHFNEVTFLGELLTYRF